MPPTQDNDDNWARFLTYFGHLKLKTPIIITEHHGMLDLAQHIAPKVEGSIGILGQNVEGRPGSIPCDVEALRQGNLTASESCPTGEPVYFQTTLFLQNAHFNPRLWTEADRMRPLALQAGA